MKKLILILALVIMVSLAGCSGFSPLFGYYGPTYKGPVTPMGDAANQAAGQPYTPIPYIGNIGHGSTAIDAGMPK